MVRFHFNNCSLITKKINLISAYFAETDELLSESPVHLTSLSTDIRHGSFKKPLVGLNGNTNAVADLFTSGELLQIQSLNEPRLVVMK